jgi:hypothetical protein
MNNFYQTFFVSGNALLWFCFINFIAAAFLYLKE